MTTPAPVEIRRLGTRLLRILWEDGHESDLPNGYLREHCPCAMCRERPRSLPIVGTATADIYPSHIAVVGRYAVGIRWSDGHDSGIYSYRTLRALCPCAQCRPAAAMGDTIR